MTHRSISIVLAVTSASLLGLQVRVPSQTPAMLQASGPRTFFNAIHTQRPSTIGRTVAVPALLSGNAAIIVSNAAPTLTNPGNQTNPVTDRYGYAGTVVSEQPAGYWRLDDFGTSVV